MALRERNERARNLGCILLAALLVAGSGCATGSLAPPEAGLGEAPPQQESVTFAPVADRERSSDDCRSRVSPLDVAGFAGEWFAVMAALQELVDANPVREYTSDPEGRFFDLLAESCECGRLLLEPFRSSSDERIAGLARDTSVLLADAGMAQRSIVERFRATDWEALGPLEARARRWSEIRPSTRELSERGAALVERIVPLLREDGRATYGPGRLRISRDGRDAALENRGRLTDLTILVETGIDPGGPLSTAARKVVKWLYHAHGLTLAPTR